MKMVTRCLAGAGSFSQCASSDNWTSLLVQDVNYGPRMDPRLDVHESSESLGSI